MKVLLAHPGTQYSFQLAKELHRQNMLYCFHTGFAFGKDSRFYQLCSKLPSNIFSKISNRFVDEVPDRYIRRQVVNEILSLIKLKYGKKQEDVIFLRNLRFQNRIPDDDIHSVDAIIGFDTSSWILAQRCRQFRKLFFLDVSIAHPVAKQKIYNQIKKMYPESNLVLQEKEARYLQLEATEIELASHIVVASTFTLKTYLKQNIPLGKISVNPYGVDKKLFKPVETKQDKLLRFVFVGLVDARKGVPFLLNAWQRIKKDNIELTLIGPVSSEMRKFLIQYPEVIVTGRKSYNEIQKILPEYDVLVFPSFFEGFGLVIPEAMCSGLPVITTTATCGPDVIDNGREGFVIDPGDLSALLYSIEYFINNSSEVSRMGTLAYQKASSLTWENYGIRWKQILTTLSNVSDVIPG